MEISANPEYTHPLSFPQASPEWYERQFTTSIHNVKREEITQMAMVDFDEKGGIMFVNRNQVQGSLQDNVQTW